MLIVGCRNPRMTLVKGMGGFNLIADREWFSLNLPPGIRPWFELKGLANPGVNGDGESAQMLRWIEDLGAKAMGRTKKDQQATQKLIQGDLGGVVDGMDDGNHAMVGRNPIGDRDIAIGFAFFQLGQGGFVQGMQALLHKCRAGGLKQGFRLDAGMGRNHHQKVVIGAEGRFLDEGSQPALGIMGVADPGMVAFIVKVG